MRAGLSIFSPATASTQVEEEALENTQDETKLRLIRVAK